MANNIGKKLDALELPMIKEERLTKEYSTVVFLDYVRKKSFDKSSYIPTFFKEELGITDAKSFLNDMMKEGYLEKNKEDAAIITSKGIDLLESQNDYIMFFELACPYITIQEYERQKRKSKGDRLFEENTITLLLSKIRHLKKDDDYIGVKNLHQDIAILYERLGHNPQAMYHSLTALYLEVSGLDYYDIFLKYVEGRISRKALEGSYDYVYISPHILEAVKRLKDFYVEEMIDTVYEKTYININLCRKEKFKELVSAVINEKFVNKEWQTYFRETFKRLIEVADKQKEKRV